MTPLIMLKRDSLEKNRQLGNKLDANNPIQLQAPDAPVITNVASMVTKINQVKVILNDLTAVVRVKR